MTMWKLKTCPRCQGDLFVDRDADGWFQQCLQCGYRREMKAIAETKPVAVRRQPPAPEAERLPASGVETPEKRRTRAAIPVRKTG
jgi:DNA-directed RNA polymerase subunit M/transcription elongation factor TFIIS